MKQFWSVTLYDVDTRAVIKNKEGIADRSSRQDLAVNSDGSVDLYFGPTAPKGLDRNWIPTTAGKAWFAYFRLYAPTEAYFDTKLPKDIGGAVLVDGYLYGSSGGLMCVDFKTGKMNW